MARCEITGKGVVTKNLVSHSNIKTKSRAFSNIQSKKFFSNQLKSSIRLKVATSTIRSIDKVGNFDTFLLQQVDKNLSATALSLKRKIIKKTSQKSKKEVKNETKN